MKKSKKSLVFSIGIFLLTLIAVGSAIMLLSYKYIEKEPIGKKAYNLLQTYQEADKYLFYIDQSAKLSASETAFDLADRGGFAGAIPCGIYLNFPVWHHKTEKDCFPDYETGFNILFNQNINIYLNLIKPKSAETIKISDSLSIYPKIPDLTYNLFFDKSNLNLIGATGKNIRINLYREGILAGTYSINPSFNTPFNYSLEEYSTLIIESEKLKNACSGEKSTDLDSCILQYITINNLSWKFFYEKLEDRYYGFDAESKYILPYYNSTAKNLEYKKPIYKFAIYFPEQTTS